MCNVCGCGETQIESHSHHDGDHHYAHEHHHEVPHAHMNSEVHHHYPAVTQVVIHHHHYYGQSEPRTVQPTHTTHHHVHEHQENGSFQPKKMNTRQDLHYGEGEAGVYVEGMSQRQLLKIETDILDKNNQLAAHNRAHFIQDNQLVLNLVSSPGSGKTTLLTETLKRIQKERGCAVIEGDQQTSNDADRIRTTGVPAIQVNTGKGCHLDAKMVHDAYNQLNLEHGGILFIENVGNLVCPASFDLGEKYKVAILSVTEGEDKPLKYPNMFAASQLMLINKMDLLPYVNFDTNECIANAKRVNPYIQVITVSATTGEGMSEWLDWLKTN